MSRWFELLDRDPPAGRSRSTNLGSMVRVAQWGSDGITGLRCGSGGASHSEEQRWWDYSGRPSFFVFVFGLPPSPLPYPTTLAEHRRRSTWLRICQAGNGTDDALRY